MTTTTPYQSTTYLSRLDHLRFFAAVLVLFHHFRGKTVAHTNVDSITEVIKIWLYGGSSGVSLFLILSGFLFCVISQAGEKEINYRKFIGNRILRIFPLVVFMFFIVICVSRGTSTPMDILRLLTLQWNTGHKTSGWGAEIFPSGPMWTVAVEFQFYLIFPFLALFLNRFGIKYLLGLLTIMIGVKFMLVGYHGPSLYNNLYHTMISRLDQFLIGMMMGALYVNGSLQRLVSSNFVRCIIFLVSIVGLTFVMYFVAKRTKYFIPFSFAAEGILWSGVLYCYLTFKFNFNSTLDKVLAYLGGLSYSFYVLHVPIGLYLLHALGLSTRADTTDAVIQTALVIFPVTLVASVMTYHFIEKPFLSLRKRYS